MSDIRTLNAAAVRQSVDIVNTVKPADLGRDTPCAGWTLADLLGHMTVQHHGFAAAARGAGADLATWRFAPAGADAVERYAAAADDVLAAFAALDTLDTPMVLPEFGDPAPAFPARLAVGFHFIDYVVHAWDVARSLGVEYRLPDDLAPTALAVTLQVPGGPSRLDRDNPAFAIELGPDDAAAPALDRILRYLGRSPEWPS